MKKLLNLKISHKRKLLNLSLQDVANKINKSKAHIYEIEIGKSDPAISTLIKIADCLELPLQYLVDDNYNIGVYPHDPYYCNKCEAYDVIKQIINQND